MPNNLRSIRLHPPWPVRRYHLREPIAPFDELERSQYQGGSNEPRRDCKASPDHTRGALPPSMGNTNDPAGGEVRHLGQRPEENLRSASRSLPTGRYWAKLRAGKSAKPTAL